MTVNTPAPTPAPVNYDVPTIDLSAYLSDPTSIEALKVVSAVRHACTTIGFFALVGHGIPRSLQDQVFKGAQKLFALPKEEKLKLERQFQAPLMNRGYEVMGTQVLQEGAAPDQKEVLLLASKTIFLNRNFTDNHRGSMCLKTSPPPTQNVQSFLNSSVPTSSPRLPSSPRPTSKSQSRHTTPP